MIAAAVRIELIALERRRRAGGRRPRRARRRRTDRGPAERARPLLVRHWERVSLQNGESLVYWLRKLVFRGAWLDHRVKEGLLDVSWIDDTGDFGYAEPQGGRTLLELAPFRPGASSSTGAERARARLDDHVPPRRRHTGPRFGPNALQILTTEHWSLLASRSLVYTEAMSRTSIFVAALTGSVVALALVAQADDFGDGFVAFALVLLPVVYFLGLRDDRASRAGESRERSLGARDESHPQRVPPAGARARALLRHEQVRRRCGHPRERVPGIGPTPHYQAFVAAPGVVAVIDSVVAGATAGIAASASISASPGRSCSVPPSSSRRSRSSRLGERQDRWVPVGLDPSSLFPPTAGR